MHKQFFVVAAAAPMVHVGDVDRNVEEITRLYRRAVDDGAGVVVFPELSVTGYTCADLFGQDLLLDAAEKAVEKLAQLTCDPLTALVVGAPVRYRGSLYNCAIFMAGGAVVAIVPKTYIPNYSEFYEKRWFRPWLNYTDTMEYAGHMACIGKKLIIEHGGINLGIEICEDLWSPMPLSVLLAIGGADVILNLSASNELIGKHKYLRDLVVQQSARLRCGYVYASAGAGESSTDLVFAGNAMIADNGHMLCESERFADTELYECASIDIGALRSDRRRYNSFYEVETSDACAIIHSPSEAMLFDPAFRLHNRKIDPMPFVPAHGGERDERCREVVDIQTAGLVQRLRAIGCKTLVVGISGGLDSTLALLIAVRAFDKLGLDRSGIYGITMPGFGTTDRTYHNALAMMRSLGVTIKEIPIAAAVRQHFADIGQDENIHDVTYENSQARERTQILMDFANLVGGIVLGTGDLSELALGWCTYNGDHMSMYGVNASVPKTLVKHLVSWIARNDDDKDLCRVLLDVVDTPISPELTPADDQGNIAQKTEDLVGPYELHDFFLYHMLRHARTPETIYMLAGRAFAGRYSHDTIKHWLKTFYRRFFSQQFKRSCMPDGPKTGSVSLSPRGDWRAPSDATAALWLSRCDKL